jgi:cell division protein FtsB
MGVLKRFFIGLLFVFLFTSLARNLFDYKKNYSFYEDYKNEHEKTLQENTRLKTQILKKSDPNEYEKIIRNKLNLLKENEVAVILPLPTPTIMHITPTPQPVPYQWYDVFFKD